MTSLKHGKLTSTIEIHTTPFGVWLLLNDGEYFLSYEQFPWFVDAKLSDIFCVELLHHHHLHWQNLDIDLDLDSLINIEKYPLIDKVS
ncbi:MAG: DUF2442 domain-containing protein [Legionellales bacterium]|nr:DUF2442 domain-containing protein [Legionellales bacterium]